MRPTRRIFLATIGAGILSGRRAAATAPLVMVYKAEPCDCCDAWVEHLRNSGLHVISHHSDDLPAMRRRAGVPRELASCHTAFIDSYVIEGHVPPASVWRLLGERPAGVLGLAVPGMPVGSPGMETPRGGASEPYTVWLFSVADPPRPYGTTVEAHPSLPRKWVTLRS